MTPDYYPATACRICLEDGAMYPIFKGNENFESVYAKLPLCLREKIQDIEGYPCNICTKCHKMSKAISNFINTFEISCKILQNKIAIIKKEILECASDNYINAMEFLHKPKLDNFMNEEPKGETVNASDHGNNGTENVLHTPKLDGFINEEPTMDIFNANCDAEEFLYTPEVNIFVNEEQEEVKDHPKLLGSLSHPNIEKISVGTNTEVDTETTNIGVDKPIKRKGKARCPKKKQHVNVKSVKQRKPSEISNGPLTQDVRSENSNREGLDNKEKMNTAQNAREQPSHKNCNQCGEKFASYNLLKRHKRAMHSPKILACTKCPMSYSTQREFECHIAQHENLRNFVCQICGNAFNSRKNLSSHISNIHNRIEKKKKKTYNCQYCDKTYISKHGAVNHERSVHTGERPEVCNICNSSFYDKSYLKAHMRLHTGDFQYKCSVCGRAYAQRCNMMSHMRNHKISELDSETLSKIKPTYMKYLRP